jgi:hypothetical protein
MSIGGTPSSKAIAYAVEPCEQWHKEYPGKPRYIIWESERFAIESASDTGGRIHILTATGILNPLEMTESEPLTWKETVQVEQDNRSEGMRVQQTHLKVGTRNEQET